MAEHTPQWANLPLDRVTWSGTDNALCRIGDELVLRIPRRESAALLVSKELDWLPHLDGLPLMTPKLRYRGRVNSGVDCDFGIFGWMPGSIATPDNIANAEDVATSLATFLKALHLKSIVGAPIAGPINNLRGIPLADMSERILPVIEMVSDEVDAKAAVELWNEALLEVYDAPSVWLHGDLKADNLLAVGGRLSAVIDWGLSAVGDPAADYATAWSWVQPSARERFSSVLGLSEGDWLRGKAWALYGAVIALSYYRGGKNELLCEQCRFALSRLDLML